MAEKIKVIMDCDPGIDDALAMAYVASNHGSLTHHFYNFP